MLSPFVIDEIRRLEEKKREQQPQLVLDLPRPMPRAQQDEPEDERGVLTIDLL